MNSELLEEEATTDSELPISVVIQILELQRLSKQVYDILNVVNALDEFAPEGVNK